jgi:Polyketide cyclase / dehydrase and lipid transport
MPPAKNSGPMDRLKAEAGGLVGAFAERAMSSVHDRVASTTGRLTDYVEGDGGPGLMAALTGARNLAEGKSPGRSMLNAGWAGLKEKVFGVFRKGKGSGTRKLKFTNIIESIEVGVPLRLAYNQWTTYHDFPSFTKKVENAEPADENKKVNWKAQVFWSHREWEATILDQRPDERIIWRSKGQKGHVDGAVTFHELAPRLTKIVVVLEYHPQGMFERTGDLWRAQGRRVRLELKHFQRHVMAHVLLNPDDVEGWRGVIEEGEVVKDHETVLDEEARERGEEPTDAAGADEAEEAAVEEAAVEEEPVDEAAADEESAEAEEEPADEEAAEGAPAEEAADADGERPSDRRRAPARSGSRGRAPARARQGATRGGAR